MVKSGMTRSGGDATEMEHFESLLEHDTADDDL